jgi:signal transduction histidine kinase
LFTASAFGQRLAVPLQVDTVRIQQLYELGKQQSGDSARKLFQRVLTLSQQHKWKKGIMWGNCHLGLCAGQEGLPYQACEYLFRGLSLAEELKNNTYIGFSLRFLAGNYLELNQTGKAMAYFRRAMPVLLASGDSTRYLVCINNIGLCYYNIGDYQQAILFFNRCLQETGPNFLDIKGYALINLAASYRQLKQYPKALHALDEFRNLSLTKRQINSIAMADIQKARVLLLMGKKQEAYALALLTYASENILTSNTRQESLEALHLISKALGKSKAALNYHEAWVELQNRNTADMQRRQLNALRFEYDNEKQKRQIEQLNGDRERDSIERKLLLIGLAVFSLFIGLLIVNNRLLDRKNKQIVEQRTQILRGQEALTVSNEQLMQLNNTLEDRVAERTKELTQLNQTLIQKNKEIQEAFFSGKSVERKRVASELHDNLGGTLSALKWQLALFEVEHLTPEEQRIYQSLLSTMDQAYSEVRLISHNMLPQELEKQGLRAALEKLIMDLNLAGRISFTMESDYQRGTLSSNVEVELYSISLELVNNILKHSRAKKATLRLLVNEEDICLQAIDDGIGLPDTDKGEGMGLRNIRNRAASLQGVVQFQQGETTGTVVDLLIKRDGLDQTGAGHTPSGRNSQSRPDHT